MTEGSASEETVRKALVHRKYVLAEFVESEREYVRRMQIAVEDYFLHIKSGASENVSPDLKNDLSTIFSTLPEIAAFHKDVFLPALEGCNWQDDPDAVMECFLKHRSEFGGVYLSFCKNKPTSDGVRVEHDKYFTSRQNELGHKLNIEDLLIAPVQRLPKYQLLIKDLLKDTRKAGLNTTKIEKALELMLKIPQETNNIICMSLIRGMSRARIISHGSLWRQDTLNFSCSTSSWEAGDQVLDLDGSCNVKNEPRHIFLFDHRIVITLPANRDGFYEYVLCFKTLNGRVAEESDDPTLFSFSTENNVTCFMKANNVKGKRDWVKDLRAILDSQMQMKKALVFGKTAPLSFQAVRMHSLSVEWSGSDSSVDSMPTSGGEEDDDHDGDWPEQTGFQNVNKSSGHTSPNYLSVPNQRSPKLQRPPKLKKKFRSATLVPPLPEDRDISEGGVLSHLVLGRPASCSLDSISESVQRKSHVLSISPRMLRRWVARKSSEQDNKLSIYFPTKSLPSFDYDGARSPDSKHHRKSVSHNEVLFITVSNLPDIAEQLYTPETGQVFLVEDISKVEVWKVKALSGGIAGVSVWVQRNCLEAYSAPISLRLWKKEYRVLKSLSAGRFSKVKEAKSKSTNEVHALKIFQEATSEEQFYRELCIGSRMKHRNLLHYHMGFQQSHVMVISMDFINGRLLFDYLLHKVSVTEKVVADLLQQVLAGLDYMHQHTVYHLDIRPENIMMDLARNAVKIIDYGAARHSGDIDEVLSQNFETCYNYEYVAPEIFQQISVGPGTDMWGVGLIIYTIFFGCTPFCGESSVRVIANITALRYSFPDLDHPPCTQYALDLIMSILVLSPSQRPSAATAMKHTWFTESVDLTENRVNMSQLRQFAIQHS